MIKRLFFMLVTCTYALAQTGPTKTWVTQPPATVTIGTAYDLEISYDAGDDGAGTEYLVGGAGLIAVQYSIVEIQSDNSAVWKAGTNVGTTTGTHTGNALKNWIIPSLPTSADISGDGKSYAIRVAMQNDQDSWASGTTDIPIVIEAAMGDSWEWNVLSPTYASSTTIDVEVKYTSDVDIAANGIRFTLWTITDGTAGGINLFSDKWHGALGNSNVLTAGTNMTATITINVPAAVQNNGTMRPTSSLTTWDPNAGDAGNLYVDHATTPAPIYTYQFRPIASNDANFTPSLLPVQNNFTVSDPLSLSDLKTNNLNIFPNPAKSIINVTNIQNVKTLSIINAIGQEVLTFKAQKTIDISSLKNGLYFLRTDTGFSQKIIKN